MGDEMHTDETVLQNLLSAIGARFESDAAFEQAAALPPKTVSNWRRNRSASYLKCLPKLALLLGVRAADLLAAEGTPEAGEARLIRAWRETAVLPDRERQALLDSISSLISLYLFAHGKQS